MRCFLALNPDKSQLDQVQALMAKLSAHYQDWRPVKIDQLHLTLCFLGETDDEQLTKLVQGLPRLADKFKPIMFQAKKLIFLPNRHRPKLIAYHIEPSKQLMCLQKDIAQFLQKAEINFDHKEFRPHLTLGRLKKKGEIEKKSLPANINFSFTANSINLWQSHLLASGAKYDLLAHFSFGQYS